jgi:epoxyqueuosine reductase QueG
MKSKKGWFMTQITGSDVRQSALALGADFCGVAELAPAQELVRQLGGEMAAQFPRAVSIGLALPSAIVDQLDRHENKAVSLVYRSHGYDAINVRLDQLASRLASILQRAGHRAFPIAASQTINNERHHGLFSHKLAAHLAGLGWIGKNCLLVTPEVGPRVRWVTVLTDAPLETGQPMDERCGSCSMCVDACPSRAFTGRRFREDEPREMRFDVAKCYAYQRKERAYPHSILCGVCLYVCPHGKRGRSASM